MTTTEKMRRHFTEAFKKEKVSQLDERKITVKQLSRLYEVSETAIYRWVKKYSKYAGKHERVVVEKESEGHKNIELLKKLAEMERLLGRKEIELEYLKKVIEFGSEYVGADIKKKYESQS